MVKEEKFAVLSTGTEVKKFTIFNNKGESIELLDYGASVHAVNVLDRNGNISDVVLGVSDPEELLGNSFEGVTIGRVANRIGYGRYTLDGKGYQLETNMGGHFLHGASGNYSYRHFEGTVDQEKNSVTFYYKDMGDGGFDCAVHAYITFSFNDESEMTIHYHMVPEDTTLISPTNHTYYNLSGGDVRKLTFEICTDQAVNRAEMGLPCDGSHSVIGTPADFTRPRVIGEAMASDDGTYFEREVRFDEFYILPEHEGYAAKLHDDETGRSIEVYTDAQSLIIFNGIAKEPTPGKNGAVYDGYCAFCMECQLVPNAINCSSFKSPVVRKGETFDSETTYRFVVEK